VVDILLRTVECWRGGKDSRLILDGIEVTEFECRLKKHSIWGPRVLGSAKEYRV
jgi:hypothetical protein